MDTKVKAARAFVFATGEREPLLNGWFEQFENTLAGCRRRRCTRLQRTVVPAEKPARLKFFPQKPKFSQ